MRTACYFIGFIIACGYHHGVYGWDARGHELVAAIAYVQLTPAVRQQVDALIHAPDSVYPVQDFIAAASFADELKQRGVTAYHHWHYISQPYAVDGRRHPLAPPHNIVWAIEQCQTMVANSQLPAWTRGFFLRMLIHLVGDIHQPLHTINVFSRQHPHGDLGGNRQSIQSPWADTVHQLWDRAGGLSVDPQMKKREQLIAVANQLRIDYPRPSSSHVVMPAHWAQQSYALAVEYGYPSGRMKLTSDSAYIQQVRQVARRQWVVAGDRLADMLNQLFDAQYHKECSSCIK